MNHPGAPAGEMEQAVRLSADGLPEFTSWSG